MDDEVETALAVLRDRLGKIFAGNAPRTRNSFADAIDYIAEFLQTARFPLDVCSELMVFVRALDELDQGSAKDFLKPADVKPAADSGETWLLRARIAIAVQVLMDNGMKRSPAATHLAKKFPELRPLLSPVVHDRCNGARRGARRSRSSIGALAVVIDGWHKRLESDGVASPEGRLAWSERDRFVAETRKDCINVTGQPPSAEQLAEVIMAKVIGLAARQSTTERVKEALKLQAGIRNRLNLKA